jgi:hypothetical protein
LTKEAAVPEPAIRAERTPNPNAMKFSLDCTVQEGTRGLTFSDPLQAALSPLARRLFQVPGVASVFLLKDFVTVTRSEDVPWESLAPAVEAALRRHFAGE